MKIIVTGGAGFIGSHLTDRLVELGHHVLVIDNLSSGRIENLNGNAEFSLCDVQQKEEILTVFKSFLPDTVFHLAAQTSVLVSTNDPVTDASINIIGTLNTLEASVLTGVRKFVFASSAAVYGNPESLPISEDHVLEPQSPYGLSKETCENYIRIVSKSNTLSHSILRYSNVYGPRQDSNGEAGVISIFSDRHLNGHSVSIFGDGMQTRDFIYVKDIVTANIAAMMVEDNLTLNVGTGIQTTIMEVVKCLEKTSNSLVFEFATKREGDIEHSSLNNQKSIQSLDWTPRYSFSSGMEEYWNTLQKEIEMV